MENKKIKIFSFFSGAGFLDLGFEKAGFDVVLVNEFKKSFLEAYVFSRKAMGMKEPAYGYFANDVNDFLGEKEKELGKYVKGAKKDGSIVGFIGGPPCPDFSVAGKQRGGEGENGKLSMSYFKLIAAQKPDFFLFENVKGLWKTKKHRTFYEKLKKIAEEAGYLTAERLTNSLEFGAPQDRDRIFMFGIKKDIFAKLYGQKELKDVFLWERHAKYGLGKIKNMPWPKTSPYAEGSVLPCPDGIYKELTAEYWFGKNDVEKHPNGKDFFRPKAGVSKMQKIEEGDVSKKSYKRLHRWRYSPTVAYGNNEVHLHPYKTRRLSVSEALALQSMPKEYVMPPGMTLTDKFKAAGNGVPFLLSYGAAETIKDFLESPGGAE